MAHRPLRYLVLLAGLLALPLARASAQDATPPREGAAHQAPDSAAAAFEAMTPMMGQMMTAMMRSSLAVLSEPATTQQMATFSKNYFDALIAKGFTREEALQIVMAVGVPMLPGGR